jgi:hypothetical protein
MIGAATVSPGFESIFSGYRILNEKESNTAATTDRIECLSCRHREGSSGSFIATRLEYETARLSYRYEFGIFHASSWRRGRSMKVQFVYGFRLSGCGASNACAVSTIRSCITPLLAITGQGLRTIVSERSIKLIRHAGASARAEQLRAHMSPKDMNGEHHAHKHVRALRR